MKRVLIALCAALAAVWTVGSFAAESFQVGVVNMQQIIQQSPQFQQMGKQLQSEFQGEKTKIEDLGKTLQANLQKYEKNKAVMTAEQLQALKQQITTEETQMRQMQVGFRQKLFVAQSQKMAQFIQEVKTAVAKIAEQKNLVLVLPNTTALYAKNDMDITPEVIHTMK